MLFNIWMMSSLLMKHFLNIEACEDGRGIG